MNRNRLKSLVVDLRRSRHPVNWGDRYGALSKAWGYVFNNELRGDYYEFGVGPGNCLSSSFIIYNRYQNWLAAGSQSADPEHREKAVRFADFEARFYGLDTFEGIPDNDEGNPIFAPGSYKCSIEAVRRRCASVGLRGDQVQLVKGLFSETAPLLFSLNPRPAGIINMDCDLYRSAKDAFAVCYHLIQDGTVLLCDDYNHFCASPDKGERRALKEFQEEKGIQFEPWFPYEYCAQAFLCHR